MSKLRVFGLVLWCVVCGCGGDTQENNGAGTVKVREVYCGSTNKDVPDFATDEQGRIFCLDNDAQVDFFVKHYSGLGFYADLTLGNVSQESLLKLRDAGLTEVGALRVSYSKTLETLRGFESVTKMTILQVEESPRMRSLEGLESVETIVYVKVQGNDNLSSLNGLQGLRYTGDRSQFGIFVNDNPKLADVSALKGVVRNTGVLSITGSEVLEVIEVGEGLEELRGLAVSHNPKLKEVRGLDGVEGFSGRCSFRGGFKTVRGENKRRE